MANLQKHRVAGRAYWRIVESRRIDGEPRPVPLLYLGSGDDLLNRLLQAPCGGTTGPVLLAWRCGGAEGGGGPTVGGLDHRSSRAQECPGTVGRHHAAAGGDQSRHSTPLQAGLGWLGAGDLAPPSVCPGATGAADKELGTKLDTLFYGATKLFTFIAFTNGRPELPQRGYSKQKCTDLRLFRLALLVSQEGQIPLCSQVCEANRVNVKVFSSP